MVNHSSCMRDAGGCTECGEILGGEAERGGDGSTGISSTADRGCGVRCVSCEYRAGAGDSCEPCDGDDPGCGAHRVPDAGEPLVRSLLWDVAGSAGLWGSASGAAAVRGTGVEAAGQDKR